MLGRLFLLFVLVPLAELALLVRLGQWLGLGPTLGLVLLTGAAGAVMARSEGVRVAARIQRELAAGRVPGDALLDGLGVLLGGVLLLTPGVVTDLLGFALLVPAGRGWLRRRVRRWLERRLEQGDLQVTVFGPRGVSGLDPRNEIRNDD